MALNSCIIRECGLVMKDLGVLFCFSLIINQDRVFIYQSVKLLHATHRSRLEWRVFVPVSEMEYKYQRRNPGISILLPISFM